MLVFLKYDIAKHGIEFKSFVNNIMDARHWSLIYDKIMYYKINYEIMPCRNKINIGILQLSKYS